MDPTTDQTETPPAAKPSRAELLELALRYAYEHDRKGTFDFDTWSAACSLVLGDIGGTSVATTTLALQQALDSYREGPTRNEEDASAQAKALWATIQSALVGGQAFADPEESRNYLSVTFVGMRGLFDRAEVHFMRPGGLTPHQRAAAAVAMAGELRAQVRTRDAALRTREEQINEVHDQRNKSAVANGELAWLVADQIWAGGITFEGVEPPTKEDAAAVTEPFTLRERGLLAAIKELRDQAQPAREALEAALRGLLDEVGAISADTYTNRQGPLSVDDAVDLLTKVAALVGRRLKAIGAKP